jgi:hypothetical protein
MLFNSPLFLFAFLPVFLVVYFARTATRFLPRGGGVGWAAVMGTAFGIAVASSLVLPTSFLYFRF